MSLYLSNNDTKQIGLATLASQTLIRIVCFLSEQQKGHHLAGDILFIINTIV